MNTPIIKALKQHSKKNADSFHVPGHKSGLINPLSSLNVGPELLKIDLTEITGLDDLHSPEEAIMEAETLLTETYGSKKSFFLVNGSTVGNLAMILATVKENDHIVVQRNCHKSIINAIKLAKAIPVFLPEKVNHDLGVSAGVDVADVGKAIELFESISAIVLTYPNYYGCTYDIEQIIELAHTNKIPVLVDEAHGAHFAVGALFPKSALQLGADVVVHSAHKSLPAMTMGSYLHFNSNLVDLKKVKEYLAMLQSSSPSYVLMASLDFARDYVQNFKVDDEVWTRKIIYEVCSDLSALEGIKVIKTDDPLKFVMQSTNNESGYSLQKRFEKFGVFTELADTKNVLFIMPLLKQGKRMKSDLVIPIKLALVADHEIQEYSQVEASTHSKISTLELTYSEMENRSEIIIDLNQAVGKISAGTIIPYPPGIPLVIRGERITREHIDKLSAIVKFNGKIQGNEHLLNRKLTVFEESTNFISRKSVRIVK